MGKNEKFVEVETELILKDIASIIDTDSLSDLDFRYQVLSLRLSNLFKIKLEELSGISLNDIIIQKLRERRDIRDKM